MSFVFFPVALPAPVVDFTSIGNSDGDIGAMGAQLNDLIAIEILG